MPLIARKTASIFTHVQISFDPGQRSLDGSQRLIDSNRAGAIFEHQFRTHGELLLHQGVVNLQEKLGDLNIPGLEQFERFVLCGGAMLMPPKYYAYNHPVTMEKVEPKRETMGSCHYYAFVELIWSIADGLKEGSPKELHFCLDSIYASGQRETARGEQLFVWRPAFKEDVLGCYGEFLRGMRIPYAIYFNGEKVLDATNPKLALFIWRTVADFLEALPAEAT